MVADLPGELAAWSWLLGSWRGDGIGGYPTIGDFRFRQEVSFEHVAGTTLRYTSRSWVLDDAGEVLRASAGEAGFWRIQPADRVEALFVFSTGVAEIHYGLRTGLSVEMASDVVARTRSAKDVAAGKRMYGLVEDRLVYVAEMAAVGERLLPHLSAQLARA